MGATLRIIPAAADPFEVAIGNTATIGRTRENTVCLNFSPLVSRQHAVIRCHNAWQYQIIDLGSRNGTFVNGQRVVMPVTLESGSRIRVADNEIVFEQQPDEFSDEQLAATLAGSDDHALAEVQSVSLLVCDIRGFSAMAEKISSSHLAQALGAWFRESGNLIQRSGGTIDKFIGDALLAYWQAQDQQPTESGLSRAANAETLNPPKGAECETTLKTALELLRLAQSMKWPIAETPFEIAVALHHGKVTCSNVGLDAQRDATIIGDAVNTVFRLESLMKSLGQRLVLSQDFVAALPTDQSFVDLGEQPLKGKRQAVRIFGLKE